MGRKYKFWSHYHRTVELCYEGNIELLDRVNSEKSEPERFYTIANIPKKYFGFEFDKIKKRILTEEENLKQINIIEKYLNSLENAAKKGIGLYLSGPHGVAKTTIATIILKKAICSHYRCFFWKSAEIVKFIKSGWRNDYRRSFFEYIINSVDFLVIDDVARLFKLDKKQDESLYIDEIFTKRDDLSLVTILTANHGLDYGKELFGEALYSNFKERLIEANLEGEDFRNVISESLIDNL